MKTLATIPYSQSAREEGKLLIPPTKVEDDVEAGG